MPTLAATAPRPIPGRKTNIGAKSLPTAYLTDTIFSLIPNSIKCNLLTNQSSDNLLILFFYEKVYTRVDGHHRVRRRKSRQRIGGRHSTFQL